MQEMKNQTILLYGTCPDMACGQAIGKAMLEARLVACVNLLPGITSLFRWDGKIQEEDEIVFVAKSTSVCWQQASNLFSKLHPYEEPALIQLDISQGLPGFLQWIGDVTAS